MSRKLREAINLFIDNWKIISLIVLTVWLPGTILLVYLRLYVFPAMTGGDELRMFSQEMRVQNAIEAIFSPFYIGALLHALSQIKRGLPVNYGQSMAHAGRRSFKFFATRLGTGLIILGGLIAFIIPGVILALRFALIDAVVTLEGLEGSQARNLSAQMTRGKRWKILGTIILSYVAVLVVIMVTYFILYLPFSLAGPEENFAIAVIYECLSNILLTLPVIVLFLFYWEAKAQPDIAIKSLR